MQMITSDNALAIAPQTRDNVYLAVMGTGNVLAIALQIMGGA